jgi:thiol-disulfide isomerase/thioredoxin
MRRVVRAGLALALAAVTLSGCSDSSRGTGTSGFPIGDGVYQEVPAAQRGEPVSLSGPTLGGGTLDLASLRGHVVVLNVWGSWCGPCRKEAPELASAAAQLTGPAAPPGPKVAFVGINTRDRQPMAQAFEAKYKITYPSIVDEGTLLLALRGAVPPNAIPTTLVLDPQGRIAARVSGPITQRTLADLVSDVAGTPGTSS